MGELKLEGKVAIVTGAGRGIGRGIAEFFAENGASVVITARTESQIEAVRAKICEMGGQVLALTGDITDEAFVDRLFEATVREFDKLDILINNAGIYPFGPVDQMPIADFRECLEVNVVAVFNCIQHAVRIMKAHGGTGKIINIGSVRSHWTEGGDAGAYNASKYGLKGLTESVARELHGSGLNIAVGMMCPGCVHLKYAETDETPEPGELTPRMIAEGVLHAVTAPAGINVYDTTIFPIYQKPW
jgi:NAD(P)-dependent dehydrogenase (short-subunit alcohol dehydrogenase family)